MDNNTLIHLVLLVVTSLAGVNSWSKHPDVHTSVPAAAGPLVIIGSWLAKNKQKLDDAVKQEPVNTSIPSTNITQLINNEVVKNLSPKKAEATKALINGFTLWIESEAETKVVQDLIVKYPDIAKIIK
jgi:hypothetical protein